MSKRLKVIVSIVIILMLVASNCIFNSFDCKAAPAGERIDEDSKTVTIYIVPYDNVKVYDAIPHTTHIVMSGGLEYEFTSKLYVKSSGKQMYLEEKTTAGVTYHYKATLDSTYHEKINDYKVLVQNSVDSNDSTIFSNISVSSPDNDTVNFECDVVFKAKPVLNMGTCNVHFAKEGGSLKSSDSRLDYIFRSLQNQVNRGLIKADYSEENKIDYDLDKNGTYDMRCSISGQSAELFPLETSSIKGAFSIDELEDRKDNAEYNFIFYYDKYVFDFSPYTPPANNNNSDNNTSNNTNNNTNNNTGSSSNNNINNNTGNSSNNNNTSNNNSGNSSNSNAGNNAKASRYQNEWVDGKWYNSEGICDYIGTLEWKCNSTGWWVEDTAGWYPQSQWQKIDGKWYYFTETGYMDYSEYRDGCWLGSDGAWVEEYSGGHWCSDSTGWWYEDSSGWYPYDQYLWIDGVNYYFGVDGYLQ